MTRMPLLPNADAQGDSDLYLVLVSRPLPLALCNQWPVASLFLGDLPSQTHLL